MDGLLLIRQVQRTGYSLYQFSHWADAALQCNALFKGIGRVDELEADELVERRDCSLKVTPRGRAFLRHICMDLDARL